jgi:hypothetical protein
MSLRDKFPKIMDGVNEEFDEYRYLIVVDENYDDIDSDEFDVYPPDDYNFLVYITPKLQDILGGDRLQELSKVLDMVEEFEDFFANEIDMFGIKTNLSEEKIAELILNKAEELI